MYKNRAYFENSGPNWSKLGSFVDKHHILHMTDLDKVEERLCNSHFSIFVYAASFEH